MKITLVKMPNQIKIVKSMKEVKCVTSCPNENCRPIKTKGMVFRYTWIYSKEDTMAHTYRAVVTS